MKTIEELDKYLCAKYPKMFRDRHASMKTTCLCWGLEIGNGWSNILLALCSNIQWHIDSDRKRRADALKFNRALSKGLPEMIKYHQGRKKEPNEWDIKYATRDFEIGLGRPVPDKVHQVVITQIKEKFGSLRFYYQGGDDEISGMVRMAESMSGVTCEECGAPGHQRGGGWIVTLCDEHAEKRGMVLSKEEEEAI